MSRPCSRQKAHSFLTIWCTRKSDSVIFNRQDHSFVLGLSRSIMVNGSMHNEILQGGFPGTTMTRRWRWREAEHKLWARPQHQRDQGKQSASMKLEKCLVNELICIGHRVVWPSNSSLQSFDTLLFGFPGLDFLVAFDRTYYEHLWTLIMSCL